MNATSAGSGKSTKEKRDRSCQLSAAGTNRRFEFQKRRQLFFCAHNETLSVAAMRVCNPDRLPVGINR
jgi:hypothetical protein